MNRTSDWLNALFFTFSAAAVGLICWSLIFFATAPLRKSETLSFPNEKQLVTTFSATAEYNESKVTIHGTLRGEPRPLKTGIVYHCLLDNLAVHDDQNLLLIAFQREPDQSYRYSIDPRLSPDERQALFTAFHIDTADSDYSADQSLFQQPFTLYISPYGQIKEISLNPILRNALHDALVTTPADTIVKTALNAPEKLPPLLPKRAFKSSWKTSGHFFSPITFHHKVAETNDKTLTITTHSQAGNGLLSANDWQLRWNYNQKTHQIEQLHLELTFVHERNFFNHHHTDQYHLNADLAFTFDTKTDEKQ